MKQIKRKIWSDLEVDLFIKLYPDTKSSDIAKMMGKSLVSVYNLAHSLQLKKSVEFNKSEASGRLVGGEKGMKYRFVKGQVAFNKGQKMQDHVYEIAKKTMFKKGNLPHNTRSDGDISIRKDRRGTPYKFIRVALGKWIPYSRFVWERANGAVPDGMCIRHKDKNPLNDQIENLELISRKDNRVRNSGHQTLSDGYIAYTIAGKNHPELIEPLKSQKELLELKRNLIKLKRQCRKQA